MTWTGADDAPPTARIAALAPSLQPSERRVAETIAGDVAAAVELTAQELAGQAGTGRATVVRTAQALGYEGFPQLRVALALEVATTDSATTAEHDGSPLGVVKNNVDRFGARLAQVTAALTEDAVADFVHRLDDAAQVLVVGHGLSAPLSLDLTLRLNSAGRPAEHLFDPVAQQIRAGQLSTDSALVAISGSGASKATLDVVDAARDAGAHVLALTSFARSAIADRADVSLAVPPVEGSFQGELVHTSRVALALVTESLVDALIAHRGDRGTDARAAVLATISGSLVD